MKKVVVAMILSIALLVSMSPSMAFAATRETTNNNSSGPILIGVTSNDTTNTMSGMTAKMEFKVSNTNWITYNPLKSNLPNLTGTLTLLVRYKETSTQKAGKISNFYFTTGTTTTIITSPVNLGTAGNYAILAKSGISTVPNSTITGDIGVSPIGATAITGFALVADATNTFATSTQVIGKVYASTYTTPTNSNLTTAVNDMQTAFTDAAGRAANYTELYVGDISGRTLTPGVYKWSTGVLINSDVTLTGGADDVFIFEVAKGITQASATKIILAGGVQAKNIFWVASGTVAIGSTAHFEGIILSQTNISLGTNASINGRLLAQTAVTLIKSTVVAPK